MFVMLWLKADSAPLSILWNWQRYGPKEMLCLGFWLQDGATEAGLRHERSDSWHGSEAIFMDGSFQEYLPRGSADHVRLWLGPNQTTALDMQCTNNCITDHSKKINIVLQGIVNCDISSFQLYISINRLVIEGVGMEMMKNKKQLLI